MVRFLSGSKKMECSEAKPHRPWGAKWLNYVWWVFWGVDIQSQVAKEEDSCPIRLGRNLCGHRKWLVQMSLRGNLLRYRSTVRSSWEA